MDELEISGKRYISSRRAGQEHRYHADYIGQLIRSGKVVGTKVGRAWYVEAASLAEYLGKETPKTEGKVERVVEGVVIEEKVAEPEAAPAEELEERRIPVVVAEEEPVAAEEEKKDTAPVIIKKTNGLKYITDDEPLFPIIKRTSHILDVHTPVPQEIVTEKVAIHTPKKIKKFRSFVAPLSVVVLGCITLAGVAVISGRVASTTIVEQGKPAVVEYAFR